MNEVDQSKYFSNQETPRINNIQDQNSIQYGTPLIQSQNEIQDQSFSPRHLQKDDEKQLCYESRLNGVQSPLMKSFVKQQSDQHLEENQPLNMLVQLLRKLHMKISISQFLNSLRARQYPQLKSMHFKLINDKASAPVVQQKIIQTQLNQKQQQQLQQQQLPNSINNKTPQINNNNNSSSIINSPEMTIQKQNSIISPTQKLSKSLEIQKVMPLQLQQNIDSSEQQFQLESGQNQQQQQPPQIDSPRVQGMTILHKLQHKRRSSNVREDIQKLKTLEMKNHTTGEFRNQASLYRLQSSQQSRISQIFNSVIHFLSRIFFCTYCCGNDNDNASDNRQEGHAFYQQNQQGMVKVQYYCSQLLRRLQKAAVHCLERLPVFDQNSNYKLAWDLGQLVWTVMFIFYIPIHIIYEFSFQWLMGAELAVLGPVLFMTDNIFYLNTGIYDKGVLINDRRVIFRHWLLNDFLYHFLCTLPLTITVFTGVGFSSQEEYISMSQGHYVNSSNSTSYSKDGVSLSNNNDQIYYGEDESSQIQHYTKYLLVLFVFKLGSLLKVINKLQETYVQSLKFYNTISLIKLMLFIMFMGHIVASLFLMSGIYQKSSGRDNWLKFNDIQEENWTIQYLFSYYYATVTMLTIGYGDVIPTTTTEKLICIFLMFISCGVFGYTLNAINQIFDAFYRIENERKKKLLVINNYMNQKSVSKHLQAEVREYLDYAWRQNQEEAVDEKEIMSQLSEQLQEKLLFEANKIVLKDSHLFKKNFTEQVIQKTVALIHEEKYTPNEKIFSSQQRDDCSIYFIEKGSVEIYMERKVRGNKQPASVSLQVFRKGQSFGEFSFFTGQPRTQNVRSAEFTTLLIVRRSDFLTLLADFAEDYEYFCYLKDRILFNRRVDLVAEECMTCGERTHYITECPFLHFIHRKQQVIGRHNFSHLQERTAEFQRRKNKFKGFKCIDKTAEKLQEYQQNNGEFLDEYERKFELQFDDLLSQSSSSDNSSQSNSSSGSSSKSSQHSSNNSSDNEQDDEQQDQIEEQEELKKNNENYNKNQILYQEEDDEEGNGQNNKKQNDNLIKKKAIGEVNNDAEYEIQINQLLGQNEITQNNNKNNNNNENHKKRNSMFEQENSIKQIQQSKLKKQKIILNNNNNNSGNINSNLNISRSLSISNSSNFKEQFNLDNSDISSIRKNSQRLSIQSITKIGEIKEENEDLNSSSEHSQAIMDKQYGQGNNKLISLNFQDNLDFIQKYNELNNKNNKHNLKSQQHIEKQQQQHPQINSNQELIQSQSQLIKNDVKQIKNNNHLMKIKDNNYEENNNQEQSGNEILTNKDKYQITQNNSNDNNKSYSESSFKNNEIDCFNSINYFESLQKPEEIDIMQWSLQMEEENKLQEKEKITTNQIRILNDFQNPSDSISLIDNSSNIQEEAEQQQQQIQKEIKINVQQKNNQLQSINLTNTTCDKNYTDSSTLQTPKAVIDHSPHGESPSNNNNNQNNVKHRCSIRNKTLNDNNGIINNKLAVEQRRSSRRIGTFVTGKQKQNEYLNFTESTNNQKINKKLFRKSSFQVPIKQEQQQSSKIRKSVLLDSKYNSDNNNLNNNIDDKFQQKLHVNQQQVQLNKKNSLQLHETPKFRRLSSQQYQNNETQYNKFQYYQKKRSQQLTNKNIPANFIPNNNNNGNNGISLYRSSSKDNSEESMYQKNVQSQNINNHQQIQITQQLIQLQQQILQNQQNYNKPTANNNVEVEQRQHRPGIFLDPVQIQKDVTVIRFNEFFKIIDFDCMKVYQLYFPNNNWIEILKQINQKRIRKRQIAKQNNLFKKAGKASSKLNLLSSLLKIRKSSGIDIQNKANKLLESQNNKKNSTINQKILQNKDIGKDEQYQVRIFQDKRRVSEKIEPKQPTGEDFLNNNQTSQRAKSFRLETDIKYIQQ